MEQQEHTLAQFIIEYMPRIPADREVGEAISAMAQWSFWDPEAPSTIWYENCPVGRFQCTNYKKCQWSRIYNAQLHFKQIRYDRSNAYLDYLQVCIT